MVESDDRKGVEHRSGYVVPDRHDEPRTASYSGTSLLGKICWTVLGLAAAGGIAYDIWKFYNPSS